jgi:hypothetical protein
MKNGPPKKTHGGNSGNDQWMISGTSLMDMNMVDFP